MARLPMPGSDDGNWGEILNNYLKIEHNSDGTQKTLGIGKGGTGATNAADALANLGTIPFFIQHTNPRHPKPHIWVQTGVGPYGDGMTVWVEDGK